MKIEKKYNYPTAIVIFGGTGNLAQTKLLPALFNLFIQDMLPSTFEIIGLARKLMSHEEYQTFVKENIRKVKGELPSEDDLSRFCLHIRFVTGDSNEDDAYEDVKDALNAFDARIGQCTSKLFYLAVSPTLYSTIFEKLKTSSALTPCAGIRESWARLLVEKPFGSDLTTAQGLEDQLCELYSEDQIYRIDHYLAKESIENIMSLRFANSILTDSWNGSKIESISLKLFEKQDVSTRGSFYDGIGALRDVGQNHMLQMLALLTMQPADLHSAADIRASRLAALKSLVMHDTDLRVRGQYHGYRETEGVDPQSETETYFKIETHVDSELWKDVRMTLESGKALNDSFAETTITFRPTNTCRCAAEPHLHTHRNVLHITFSPGQCIRLTMWVKEPGFEFKLHKRELELAKQEGEVFRSPEAYERVLYDCIIGDQTRFVSGEETVAAWNFITPLLESFRALPLHEYEKGSTDPIPDVT